MHKAVLLNESVQALVTRRAGYYVDGTFGRGGHSRALLHCLTQCGRLLGLDKDPAAVAVGESLQTQDSRFVMRHGSFADLAVHLQAQAWPAIDGLLLDLGVSTPQLQEAERGFSFLHDGPLDMRMDPSTGCSAAQWLAQARQEDIADVLKRYGEERYAKRIAKAIVQARSHQPLESTGQLAEVVSKAHPAWIPGKHPATKTFQAIRLWVNDEINALTRLLEQVLDCLAPGGRLVIISFHSLEDRLVKRFIAEQVKGDFFPRALPITQAQLKPRLKAIGKPCRASAEELDDNRSARSAIMRVAEKIDDHP